MLCLVDSTPEFDLLSVNSLDDVENVMSTRGRVAVGCLLPVLLVAACSSSEQAGVQINSLWYGKNPGEYGVTHVQIDSLATDPAKAFTVDLAGLTDSGTDDVWNSAAWTGASIAALMSGLDPRGRGLAFDVEEAIGGPSAGALMSAGSIAALAGVPVRNDVAATGTVLADGSIGPVSGVLDKLRAAKAAGLTTVAYPAALETSFDRDTGRTEDIQDFAGKIGIDVVPVSTVAQLVQVVAPDVPSPKQDKPGAMDSKLVVQLRNATIASLARMARPGFVVAQTSQEQAERRELAVRVAGVEATARRQLANGEVFEAFANVTSTERSVLRWNARQATIVAASASMSKTQADLLSSARRQLQQTVTVRQRSAAAMKLTMVEQVAAAPDALSWATDAIATISATIDILEEPTSSAVELADQASDLAQVGYDVEYYLPVSVTAAQSVGRRPIVDRAQLTGVLAAYSGLLGDAGQANLAYVETDEQPDSKQLPDDELATILRQRSQDDLTRAGTDLSGMLVALSSALSFYTQTVTLAAGRDAFDSGVGRVGDTDRITITDPAYFSGLVSTAGEQSTTQARIVAGAMLDPSYVQWGTRWGLSAATDSSATSDADRREGLVYLWYSTTSGRLLTALAAAQ